MLENLYTTKMSNDKEKLKTRLENIQREPKKKHTALGLLVTLVLAAALTVGTLCLASNENKAGDVTMTDEEFAVFLEQPWGAVMASLDYADEEILVFHYNQALCVVDLANQCTFRHILDLSDLNLTTADQGDVFLQVDVARDGSQAYLSVGGVTDLAAEYDSYVADLTTGQVKKGKIPEDADLFRGQKDTFAVIPDVAGWSSLCITVGDRTYYLNNGGPMVSQLQLVTHYANGRPDSVWSLFGEPSNPPTEPVTEDIDSEANEPIADSTPVSSSTSGSNSSGDSQGDATLSDPPLQQTGHFSELSFQVGNTLTDDFGRALSPYYDIMEMSVTDWEMAGKDEATFHYVVTYRPDSPPEYAGNGLPPTGTFGHLSYSMKVTRDENGLTFYRDMGGIGGGEYTGPEWVPTDVQSLVSLP